MGYISRRRGIVDPTTVRLAPAGPPPRSGEEKGQWTPDAEAELRKIPFFVRGKARRNTEAFALAAGRDEIDLATLYDAKAHYGR